MNAIIEVLITSEAEWTPSGWSTPINSATVPIDRWTRQQLDTQFHEALAKEHQQLTSRQKWEMMFGFARPTARDAYGWRGLTGTSWIGRQP